VSCQYLAAVSLQETENEDNNNANHIPYAAELDYVGRRALPGIPPAILQVKVGGLYRILHNFSLDRGLVKNARVSVTDIGINVRLLGDNDSLNNEDILLPCITFSSRLPSAHTLIRKQFPIAAAHATTFNSCQGLTL